MTRPVGAGEREVNADAGFGDDPRGAETWVTRNRRSGGLVQLRGEDLAVAVVHDQQRRRVERGDVDAEAREQQRQHRSVRAQDGRLGVGEQVVESDWAASSSACSSDRARVWLVASTCSSTYGCTVCTHRVLEEVTTRVMPYAASSGVRLFA